MEVELWQTPIAIATDKRFYIAMRLWGHAFMVIIFNNNHLPFHKGLTPLVTVAMLDTLFDNSACLR